MTAKYALELRMEHNKQFGDESVIQRLLPKYEEAKECYHKVYLKKDVKKLIKVVYKILKKKV